MQLLTRNTLVCAAKRANESNVRNAGWRNGTGKWGVSAVCVNVGLRTRVDSLHCAAFDDTHAGVTVEASSSGAGALRSGKVSPCKHSMPAAPRTRTSHHAPWGRPPRAAADLTSHVHAWRTSLSQETVSAPIGGRGLSRQAPHACPSSPQATRLNPASSRPIGSP